MAVELKKEDIFSALKAPTAEPMPDMLGQVNALLSNPLVQKYLSRILDRIPMLAPREQAAQSLEQKSAQLESGKLDISSEIIIDALQGFVAGILTKNPEMTLKEFLSYIETHRAEFIKLINTSLKVFSGATK